MEIVNTSIERLVAQMIGDAACVSPEEIVATKRIIEYCPSIQMLLIRD